MRTFALSKSKALSVVVCALSLVPLGTNLVSPFIAAYLSQFLNYFSLPFNAVPGRIRIRRVL